MRVANRRPQTCQKRRRGQDGHDATLQRPDPTIEQTGVLAGVVEHGVMAFDLTGVPRPEHTSTEYWATAHSWRSITRDAAGTVISRALSSPSGSASVSNINDRLSF